MKEELLLYLDGSIKGIDRIRKIDEHRISDLFDQAAAVCLDDRHGHAVMGPEHFPAADIAMGLEKSCRTHDIREKYGNIPHGGVGIGFQKRGQEIPYRFFLGCNIKAHGIRIIYRQRHGKLNWLCP